jgi:hypothetical protein
MSELEKCSHPVPKNDFGIFAMHCKDNQPISLGDLKKVIDDPVTSVEPALQEELSKMILE